jgi:hypothetical protein
VALNIHFIYFSQFRQDHCKGDSFKHCLWRWQSLSI